MLVEVVWKIWVLIDQGQEGLQHGTAGTAPNTMPGQDSENDLNIDLGIWFRLEMERI